MSEGTNAHPVNRFRRFDFESEVMDMDEQTHTATMRFIPDPRRYVEVKKDGKTWHLDKYLNEMISLEEMVEGMQSLEGDRHVPMYHLPSAIKSTSAYAAARLVAVQHELETGEHSPPDEKPLAHRGLEDRGETRYLAFISVDICGATALRHMNPDGFDRAYELFLKELGTIVGQFNGALLKTKGDGFVAYIDHPSFTSQCDSTIDLGLSLLFVLQNSLNPALAEAGLPELNVRVGADYGEAAIRSVSIPATGFLGTEIASDALNRAVKIEESCCANEFRIGRALYELIHVQWLERAKEVPFDGDTVGIASYRTYRVA